MENQESDIEKSRSSGPWRCLSPSQQLCPRTTAYSVPKTMVRWVMGCVGYLLQFPRGFVETETLWGGVCVCGVLPPENLENLTWWTHGFFLCVLRAAELRGLLSEDRKSDLRGMCVCVCVCAPFEDSETVRHTLSALLCFGTSLLRGLLPRKDRPKILCACLSDLERSYHRNDVFLREISKSKSEAPMGSVSVSFLTALLCRRLLKKTTTNCMCASSWSRTRNRKRPCFRRLLDVPPSSQRYRN